MTGAFNSDGDTNTDAVIFSKDDLVLNGTGTLTIQSPFDYDGSAEKNGGTIIVNGTETDEITNQMMGGGPGMQGGPGR